MDECFTRENARLTQFGEKTMFLLCDVVFIEKKMGVRAVFSVVVHYLSEGR